MSLSRSGSQAYSERGDTNVVVRSVASMPGLAAHCQNLARRAGVEGRHPASFALFGSAVRAAWTGEQWRDVNVALDAEALPRSIIADADFTVCQVAVCDGHLFYSSRFLDDVARRTVVVNRIDACAPLVTLLRMYKYAARGYAVPGAAVHRVLEAVRRAPATRLDPAAILRHGGGVVRSMTLAHDVGGAPTCVRRRADEFPRAAELIASLRKAIDGRVGRPLSYHVVGGFARACVTGDEFSDVDVVAAAKGDRAALQSLAGNSFEMTDASSRVVSVRLDVARRVVPSPGALIAGIELVMARLAFSTTDQCFHLDPGCLEALATRTMSLRPVDQRFVSAARTIRRTLKYASRGYRLPMEALLETIQEYRRTPALLRWGDYRLRTLLHRPERGTAELSG